MLHRIVALGSALLFLCAESISGSAPVPDLATIRANVARAEGTKPVNERLETIVVSNGVKADAVELRDGADEREDSTLGPFSFARGVYGGQHWFRNENGETAYVQPDPGKAKPDALTTTVKHVATPLDAYVIAELNADGYGTKEYIDPVTWRLVRRDYVTASETTTIQYDDFRTTAGYTRACHWTSRDGLRVDDADSNIVSDTVGEVKKSDLAIPPSLRNLVEFPAGKSTVALPVRLEDGAFIVRVNVGSRGLDFLLDTGASGITIDEDVAEQLGLQLYAPRSSAASAGRYIAHRAIVPEMRVGDLDMHDVAVFTTPELRQEVPGEYKIVGLLGFDFIGSVSLKLDYEAGTATAYDPSTFTPPTDPGTDLLDVRFSDGAPMTDVIVNGARAERFTVDTGDQGGLVLFEYFLRRYPEALKGSQVIGDNAVAYGVGGTVDIAPYRLAKVQLGQIVFANFRAWVPAKLGPYGGNEDGLVGTDFLRFFTLYIDYATSAIYLVPNKLGRS